MNRAFAALLVGGVCLAACTPPLNAQTAEAAWVRCDTMGAPNLRLSACTRVIDFAGTSPERRCAALIVRGSIRSNSGQYARALADFGRALRIDSANAQAYFERALVHQARGAYEIALRDLDRALAIQPGLQPALDQREETIRLRAKAYEDELAALDDELADDPTSTSLLNNRCWLRVTHDGALDAALADCNAAILADPESAPAYDSRGLVHLKRGDHASAVADYEAALAREPDRPHYLYGRGLARVAAGQIGAGDADLAAALEAQPDIADIYRSYGVTRAAPPASAPNAVVTTPPAPWRAPSQPRTFQG